MLFLFPLMLLDTTWVWGTMSDDLRSQGAHHFCCLPSCLRQYCISVSTMWPTGMFLQVTLINPVLLEMCDIHCRYVLRSLFYKLLYKCSATKELISRPMWPHLISPWVFEEVFILNVVNIRDIVVIDHDCYNVISNINSILERKEIFLKIKYKGKQLR